MVRKAVELKYPIFVRLKDCGEVRKYSSAMAMQHDFERIDVENQEYEAWDATGLQLSLSVQEPIWIKVETAGSNAAQGDLSDAIRQFAVAQGVHVDIPLLHEDQFAKALDQITTAMHQKRKSTSIWRRLIRTT